VSLIVDISNRTGELADADLVALKRAGIEAAIVGLQYPAPPYPPGCAQQQIPALAAASIPVLGCYAESQEIAAVWPNVAHLAWAIPQIFQACEEDFVDRAWIDRGLDFADALNLGQRAGIYTGGWWWRGKEFEHWYGDRDLWAAQYDAAFDLSFLPFGDWTACKYKQVVGNARIGHLVCDLSVSPRWA
jgi:hypothetical protein